MVKEYLEIERRWLLSGLPSNEILRAVDVELVGFTTVYVLSDPDLELRIRQRMVDRERTTYSVVTKVGSGLKRQESPRLHVDVDLFNYYMVMGKPYLSKDHWEILLGVGRNLEINRFTQPKLEGLVFAEMEFESEKAASAFNVDDFPMWLKPLIVKEVTDDERYNGKNLAVHGRPDPE